MTRLPYIFGPFVFCLMLLASCGEKASPVVDYLNERSYYFHYRNLDSTKIYADSALHLAGNYGSGRAEALNNLAFTEMAAMRYDKATKLLDEVAETTDNQLELLVADIQHMKLCQKRSQNKDFYVYNNRAQSRLRRIRTEDFAFNDHGKQRLAYAQTEYRIVTSTYYYYVGLKQESRAMIDSIDIYGQVQRDTAQLLNYWYNIGAGGIVQGDAQHVAQEEFNYLMGCYYMSVEFGYPYWEAQALQAISEHLQDPCQRRQIIAANTPAIMSVNTDNMPDSLIAGNLAQRALGLFAEYGDVYQTAGAYRTLGECFWHIGDNRSALICLNRALDNDTAIAQAPDLVASIREDLCLVYSAVDDKPNSDFNRNIYLDLQEQTRQDRQLEARASQLDQSSRELNIMLGVVTLLLATMSTMLVRLFMRRKHEDNSFSIATLLVPLQQWKQRNDEQNKQRAEDMSLINERIEVARLHLQQNKHRNLEQRAKVQFVCSIQPLIDRMVNEVKRAKRLGDESGLDSDGRRGSLEYIAELSDSINELNNILTRWIQMRQGELSLKIESFAVQQLFDIVAHSAMSFRMKGLQLNVVSTDCTVKADRVLTLFMINTIADNARKFTPEGGKVDIEASQGDGYVEICVTDNGTGMDEDTAAHVFDRAYTGGHGFGLKNCKGIIEKYKKVSRIFNVCDIEAESTVGKGTRIFFRLPLGRMRTIIAALAMTATMSCMPMIASAATHNTKAAQYADSAYACNIRGDYERTLLYADSCHAVLTPQDTAIILDISNEAAVAALALHRWDVYKENNQVYTRLFREASTDDSLPSYVRTMQRSKTNKTVAVTLLVLMVIVFFPAYYFLFYRHKLNYKLCIDRIKSMNDLLLSDTTDEEKLEGIRRLKDFDKYHLTTEQRQSLESIVTQIEDALLNSIDNKTAIDTETEMAEDECRRIEMESDRLHVSNSILDNCLSTLKHETMYYPSRIRQMLSRDGSDIEAVGEVVDYYHDLYSILSGQAVRQVLPQKIDRDTVAYMFDILRRCNQGVPVGTTVSYTDGQYAKLLVSMDKLQVDDNQMAALFTQSTVNIDMLLVRQTVREMGEATNLRACGISAKRGNDGGVVVEILMPKRFTAPPLSPLPHNGEG